jgi:hypothetical protein
MVLVDQWVDESGGSVIVVSLMISVILSSPWVLGVPGRGASASVPTP